MSNDEIPQMPNASGDSLVYTEDTMSILLAEDQSKVRFALRVLLEQQPGFEVLDEAVDLGDLFTRAKKAHPKIVLLSWELPGLNSDCLSLLRKHSPDTAVIALSGRPEARQAALEAGVDAFVSKADPPERLLDTIERVQRERHKPTGNPAPA